LRAGKHVPFHKALDIFAIQRCGRPHDKVLGYLGLPNSRMQIDYSVSTLGLFTAILTDYLLSVGLITEDLTPIRRRTEVMRTGWALGNANNLIAPLSASSLNLYDPVVNSMFYEVSKFFAPGFEENLLATTLSNWWYSCSSDAQDQKFDGFINDNDTFELGYI
jgi:hypothetical protein